MAEIEASVNLACSIEEAFDFLTRPENIARISPPESGFCIIEAPEILTLGAEFEFKIQGFGQIQQMVHRVTQYERPRMYVDEQIEGPLGHWAHEHILTENDNGVTLTDKVTFSPPGGLLGLLISEAKLLDSLDDGFYHRHRKLEEIFG